MRLTPWLRTGIEAVLLTLASSVLALCVNAFRENGLPLVARVPYEILVPCPEPGGPVTALDAAAPALSESRLFLIDARDGVAFGRSHLPGAVNVPYDWLDPVPDDEMKRLAATIASSRVTRVIVYGDGGNPDSGEHLGREISGRGIRNVHFVRGGAPALLPGDRR